VIFFSSDAYLLEPDWVLAGTPKAREFLKKIQDVGANGGTDPTNALAYAFTKLNPIPHELFLLTDGHFGSDPSRLLQQLNGGADQTRIHTIGLGQDVDAATLEAIAKQYGNSGLASNLNLEFVGAAGQSFGAFNINGLNLSLIGEANDYIGKGINGGSISIKPKPDCTFNPADNSIVGNTCLYGATGGYLFVNGRAGERFGVRNSGAKAVVEGTGDHCCEYMTGGVVVVLGTTGRNVGAGMTGGIAYFLDIDGKFKERLSQEVLKVQNVVTAAGESQLKELIQSSYENTGSSRAKEILDNWSTYLLKFWQVVPPSEQNSPEAIDVVSISAIV
jgi:glutamate synthase (ferredoxin)